MTQIKLIPNSDHVVGNLSPILIMLSAEGQMTGQMSGGRFLLDLTR